jgi:two-component system chemotaxis sensor kinase CheA
MQNGLDDAFWQEFAAESEEHLDTAERLLAQPPDGAGLAPLFRAFHSLKGMSAALGLAGMARVAHRCEDLLGLARQGRLAITPAVVEGLLAAVDALRGQRVTVLRTRADKPPPPGLLRRLEELEGGTPATAPPPPATAPGPAGPSALASLAAMLHAQAAALAATALAMGGPPAAVLAIAGEATRLGQNRLAATLACLGAEAALPLLGRLRRQLDALTALSGMEAGGSAMAAAAATAGEASLLPRLGDLATLLDAAGPGTRDAAAAAAGIAAALGHDVLEDWLLLAEDLADRAPTDPEAATLLARTAPLLAGHLRRCAGEGAAALRALPPAGLREAPAETPVPEELAPLLSAADHQRLEEALAAGRNLYRARLGVPSSADEEAAMQAWLAAQDAEILTSRTLLDTAPPALDMLFLAPAKPHSMSAARAAFDPAGQRILALSALRTAAAPREPEAAAPAATLRVRQDAVDTIITLEAELHAAVLALDGVLEAAEGDDLPATLAAIARRAGGRVGGELAALAARLADARLPRVSARSQLFLTLRRLDEAVMELRVVPIGTLFARLPRIVRSVAQAAGKEVMLEMEGQEVRIDRALVELLADPLLHLARNAVDHGIETPKARLAAGKPARAALRVRAERHTEVIRVEISDDGRGIDRGVVLRAAVSRGLVTGAEAAGMDDAAARRLLFRPGFSTREQVSDTSGRGVGLDVVQEAVRRAGGTLDLLSTPAQGTTFVLNLPLSAATAAVLLVKVSGHVYALPTARVEAVAEAGEGAVPLAALLGLPPGEAAVTVALRQTTGGQVALAVDAVLSRTELLLRPLPPALALLPAVGGVGILSNGEPVVILEPDGIAATNPAHKRNPA